MKLTINLLNYDNEINDLFDINNTVKKMLCKHYGGYTSVKRSGGWVSDGGVLFEDTGELVTVYVTGKANRANAVKQMKRIARLYRIKARQECVLITINDKALFI